MQAQPNLQLAFDERLTIEAPLTAPAWRGLWQGCIMTLSKNEFAVLSALAAQGKPAGSAPGAPIDSQRALAQTCGLSLGSVNKALRAAADRGEVDGFSLTDAGWAALAPYKVDNAIIMAAGLSSRFAPISYERPKGVLTVRGEVLIERQIRQLHEAGVTDITVVVGYMKESFFYLEDKFGVKIRVNEDYLTRNNNSTLYLVREQLGNTYICSSDDYFTENVFEPYVYQAYYACVMFPGQTDEYCLSYGAGGRITGVSVGGRDSYGMLGHAYFDRAFSRHFVEVLEAEYDLPETAPKLWEDIFADHVREFDMVIRPYDASVIHEFDSLDELRGFDQDFILNVDSTILDNICRVFECQRTDICDIVPIKQGLTNLSFRFSVKGRLYVYRHPGVGTEEIINRESETFSQQVAKQLGIDDTFITEDPVQGWKISRFIPDCTEFDYHNPRHVEAALALGRTLHGSGASSRWTFDLYEQACGIVELLGSRTYPAFQDFPELQHMAHELAGAVQGDGVEPCLCHDDFYAPNFLVHGDQVSLIDWEYSAMSDYASDLGTFICCSDYTMEQAEQVIAAYFQRTPTAPELRHCLAYVGLAAYYWFVWALYKEATGDPVGEWLYLWYRAAKAFGSRALELYAQKQAR